MGLIEGLRSSGRFDSPQGDDGGARSLRRRRHAEVLAILTRRDLEMARKAATQQLRTGKAAAVRDLFHAVVRRCELSSGSFDAKSPTPEGDFTPVTGGVCGGLNWRWRRLWLVMITFAYTNPEIYR
jgi:hypothetical protein